MLMNNEQLSICKSAGKSAEITVAINVTTAIDTTFTLKIQKI